MKSNELEICKGLAIAIINGSNFAKKIAENQYRLLENRIDLARHFSDKDEHEVCIDIEVISAKASEWHSQIHNSIKSLMVTANEMGKTTEEAIIINKKMNDIRVAAKTPAKKAPVDNFDVSKLKRFQDEYLSDPAFVYFMNKSKLATGTNLSSGLLGMDKVIAKIAGYDTALTNYHNISLLAEKKKSKRTPTKTQEPSNKKMLENESNAMREVRIKLQKSMSTCEEMWLSIIGSLDINEKEFNSLDRDTSSIVAREMAAAGLKAGSVAKIRVPLMTMHDDLVSEIREQLDLFIKKSDTVSQKINPAKLIRW